MGLFRRRHKLYKNTLAASGFAVLLTVVLSIVNATAVQAENNDRTYYGRSISNGAGQPAASLATVGTVTPAPGITGVSDIPAGAVMRFAARISTDRDINGPLFIWVNVQTNESNLTMTGDGTGITYDVPNQNSGYASRGRADGCILQKSTNGDRNFSCGAWGSGKSVYWRVGSMRAGESREFGFNVHVESSALAGAPINIAAHTSRDDVTRPKCTDGTYPNCLEAYFTDTPSYTDIFRYEIGSGNVTGHVKSIVDFDTSRTVTKALSDVPIRYGRTLCPAFGTSIAATNANGNYTFNEKDGAAFCIGVPNTFTDNNNTPDGGDDTDYAQESPDRFNQVTAGDCSTSDFYNFDLTCHSNPATANEDRAADNYNFNYRPVARRPIITNKTVAPTGPQQPGTPLTYDVTSTSNQDALVNNFLFQDPVPQNIDPNTARINSASLELNLPAFNGFPRLTYPLSCDGAVHRADFNYRCSVINDSIPRVEIWFERLNVRATVKVNWTGNIKPAQHVGVYPYGISLCGNRATRVTECEEYSAGLQGVINQARVGMDNGASGFNLSPITYNAIPGQVVCLGKWTTMQTSPVAGETDDIGECGAERPINGNRWVYSPTEAGYTSAQFWLRTNVNTNPAAGWTGPVNYYVNDQADGAALDPAIDPASVVVNTPGATRTPTGGIQWAGIRSTDYSGSIKEFYFSASFRGVGLGHTLSNTGQMCYVEYWNPAPRAAVCPFNNTIATTEINVTHPYITTTNGDVHVGGGAGACVAPNQVNVKSRHLNPNAKADYMVTATGDIGISSSIGANAKNYGPICRPDLVGSVSTYASRAPANQIVIPAGTQIPSSQVAWEGKVIKVNGDYTINGNVQIDSRWTLWVTGNLFINGNLTSKPGLLNGAAEQWHPSLGVVVGGSVGGGAVGVSPGVTNINGFLYSTSVINTCAGSAAGTPTLSAGYTVAQCSQRLTVNGLMMADRFRLNRTSAPAAQSSELVNLTGNLYTATPPGFSDLGKQYLPPIYIGERAPRY